jgi:transcriptional regulator GlxA family with amidase domain
VRASARTEQDNLSKAKHGGVDRLGCAQRAGRSLTSPLNEAKKDEVVMDIVCVIFDEITALDAIGPYEVLWRMPDTRFRFAAPRAGLVRTENKCLGLAADLALSEVERCDLLLIAGGFGARKLAHEATVVRELTRIDLTTRLTASVCTGAILLAATGQLRGRKATTHWDYFDELRAFGAEPVSERYVRDGKYATAAGVSAGIDLGLALALELAGQQVAEAIQLSMEYDPAPPLSAGNAARAPAALRAALHKRNHARDAELAAQKA